MINFNKSIIVFIILFITLQSNIFAQKNEIATAFSLHYDIVSIAPNDNNYFRQSLDGLSPSMELSFTHTTKQNFIYKTGIRYLKFGHNIHVEYPPPLDNIYHGPFFAMYEIIEIPLQIGYSFDLNNHFSLMLMSGASFHHIYNVMLGGFEGYYTFPNTNNNQRLIFDLDNCLQQRFNILISNSITLSYITKRNINYSLFCTYNSGLFDMWHEKVRLEIDNASEIYEPTITSRGSYWNFGIGIGYVFKSKKKE